MRTQLDSRHLFTSTSCRISFPFLSFLSHTRNYTLNKSISQVSFNMPHAVDSYWTSVEQDYQQQLQIVEGPNEPTIRFPLVLQPHEPAKDKAEVLHGISTIAAQPTETNEQSKLRQLLDANGGVVHFKGLPLKTPEDFSDFLVSLAGKGDHAWKPHTDVGMEVLRRPRAKHVLTTNE